MTKQVNKKRNPLFMSMILIMVVMIPVLFSCSMEKSEVTAPETETKIVDQKSEEAPANVQTEQIEEAETDKTFMVVEDMPTFPGGQQALYQYIGENLVSPEDAKLEGIQGRVIIGFVVEEDGSISNVETVEGIGHGCDEAAMKVIEGMPNWNPGKQRGKAVRVAYRIPMSFKLQ
jgi:protein TonB